MSAEIVSMHEIAERFGVTYEAVRKWRERHDDFPADLGVRVGPVWHWLDVRLWAEKHGRG